MEAKRRSQSGGGRATEAECRGHPRERSGGTRSVGGNECKRQNHGGRAVQAESWSGGGRVAESGPQRRGHKDVAAKAERQSWCGRAKAAGPRQRN